ncbi:MAG: trypsin-like peptidase domain-containing protein [Planctomycetota bacterium]|nr:trypsin-like peptidase domain-containing protein [Planctomycetota bacterium]MEC9048377.1 trypsin-like peptidase domain-containing protein [Planctomycetota bacterium]
MRAQLLHLSGPLRGRTGTYPEQVVRVGSAPHVEVTLAHALVAGDHARIEWQQEECKFHLRRDDGQVFVNGDEVEEIILKDGDLIEFGPGGPMARFRTDVPMGAVCKPVRRMLSDAAEVARYSGTMTATRALTSDLFTRATPRLKVGFPLLVAAVVGLYFLVGAQLMQGDGRLTADRVTRQEVEQLRAEYQAEIERLKQASSVVREIQSKWSRGVCMIHGIYRLRMSDGAWFEPRPGKPWQSEYTGSGFLVRADGYIVTNRHVALPWTEDQDIQSVIQVGAEPVFTELTVTFPGHMPVDVEQGSIRRREDDLDVAVLRVTPQEAAGVPVLPLRSDGTEGDDERAIVVGYPTGLAALLARASSGTLERLRSSAANMTDAIRQLAKSGNISPVITQGIVSNAEGHVIAYDAATTSGGSGGPVFSGEGDVIAVNFAIQRNFDGNNLGVPIRFARELLPE